MFVDYVSTPKGTYTLVESTRHGSACNNAKKTNGIQIQQPFGEGYLLKKTINYKLGVAGARELAIEKARKYIAENL